MIAMRSRKVARSRRSTGAPPRSSETAIRSSCEIDRRGRCEGVRVDRRRQRIVAIVPDLRPQQQPRVRDRAAHRPEHRERRPAEGAPLAWHQARRRPEPDDAAERGRNAQGAAGVRPGRERQHGGREGDGRAARRAAAASRRIERVARRPIDRVVGVGTGAELGRVGLADDDRAGAAHRGDEPVVGGGHIVAIKRRAIGRGDAFGLLQILDADRQPVQQPERFTRHDRRLRRARLFPRASQRGRGDGIERRIDGRDALQAILEQRNGRYRLHADEPPQLHRAQIAEMVHARPPAAPSCAAGAAAATWRSPEEAAHEARRPHRGISRRSDELAARHPCPSRSSGFEEQRTSDLVAQKLAEFGFEVHRGIGQDRGRRPLRRRQRRRARSGCGPTWTALPIEEANRSSPTARTIDGPHACLRP